jgi:acyl-CoA synthetase (AMP-forming)/AMP-acid ligase II
MPRATVFMGVPTLYVRMLAEPALDRDAVRNMRLFIAGSAPLLIETFAEWQQRTGHTILERYGMSETAMLTSNPYAADKRYNGQSERRGGTVGFPLPACRCACRTTRARPAHRRDRRHPGQGPQRLQGLLAHAREDERRVHRRRLLQDR